MHRLNTSELLILAVLMMVFLFYYQVKSWLGMLFRMRWLFVSMMLIYAFSTPGEYLAFLPMEFSITYEGLHEGLLQVSRLALMLAAIALLIATTLRADLIAGFYLLMRPLRLVGLAPERFAARLCLTLQYLEEAKAQPTNQSNVQNNTLWHQLLAMKLNEVNLSPASQTIALNVPSLKAFDFIAVFALITLVWFL